MIFLFINKTPTAEARQQYAETSSWNMSRLTNGAQLNGTGAPCPGGFYATTINFLCDANATDPVLVNTVDDYAGCFAEFEMRTSVACGVAPPNATFCYVSGKLCPVFFAPSPPRFF